MKKELLITTQKVIMIADDNQGILDVMKLMLEHAGYKTITTIDGEDIHKLGSSLPDMLFLDIMLSGTDGRELCKALKGNPKTHNLPVVMFSANGDVAEMSHLCGADDFLEKPFQMKEMLSLVEKYT